ncbi:hypothetical protein D3C74_287860 [compost metagenome]
MNESTTPADGDQAPIRVWSHDRKGRIEGRVVASDDTWTTIVCTAPNRHADEGERLTFRTSLAKEVTP